MRNYVQSFIGKATAWNSRSLGPRFSDLSLCLVGYFISWLCGTISASTLHLLELNRLPALLVLYKSRVLPSVQSGRRDTDGFTLWEIILLLALDRISCIPAFSQLKDYLALSQALLQIHLYSESFLIGSKKFLNLHFGSLTLLRFSIASVVIFCSTCNSLNSCNFSNV